MTAERAVKSIKPGAHIFIGTGCGEPQSLVRALADISTHIIDAGIYHFLTLGATPHLVDALANKFRFESFFINSGVRDTIWEGQGDYIPIFLSEIPKQIETGRIPVDTALIQVSPPDENGMCCYGPSVDITKSAAESARMVIAQVNSHVPLVIGDSFINVNDIDILILRDEPLMEYPSEEITDEIKEIGRYVAQLVDNGSTVQLGIGRIPHAVAECLKDKKDLGIHTEMFTDGIIDLVRSGAVTGMQKTINRGKIIASFVLGTKRLFDFINRNPLIELHPSEYVNDPLIISQHDNMVAINVALEVDLTGQAGLDSSNRSKQKINVALEVDLTGQVCADSIGYRFYSGIGGQVDFIRGASRSKGGKPIIAMPSTARKGEISRIVSHLSEGAGVVTTRGDVHYVVTEYGIADLHAKNVRERAMSLIGIAHPKFRNELLKAAKKLHYVYSDQIELPWDQIEYPKKYETTTTLKDGAEVFYRPIKPADEKPLRDMFYSLSSRSIYLRFFMPLKDMSHYRTQPFVSIDYKNELAIVGTIQDTSGEKIIAVGRYIKNPGTSTAETAFLVQDQWQSKGIGKFLLEYLVKIARENGFTGFTAEVLLENKNMLQVVHNSSYKITSKFEDGIYHISFSFVEE